MIICSAKSGQITKMGDNPTGQLMQRIPLEFTGATAASVYAAGPPIAVTTTVTFANDILTVGVPATPADCAVYTMPPGISGRILRAGIVFDKLAFESNAWAPGDTAGTILFQRIARGGLALATFATLTLPQAAPAVGGAGVINDAEYTVVTAVGPPAFPTVFAGGDCFYAFTSVARVIAGGGVQGMYTPFIDVMIDAIAAEADPTVLGNLYAR